MSFEELIPKRIFSDEDLAKSPIRNYLKGKTIFLTGATGFLGQLLLEKLLRCDVKMVYLLVRAKKGKPPIERFKTFFAEVQFSELRAFNPNFEEHICIIEGSMSGIGLNIRSNDLKQMEDTVEIVLHAAADVRFNERLLDLTLTNLRGTRELLKLCVQFKRLQVFTYVSTAYSNCGLDKFIKEKFYEPPIDPDVMISIAERCANHPELGDVFDVITERLLGNWPNNYAFSKSLCEAMVHRYSDKLPVCVVRPSIVLSTYRDPIPGWSNSITGMNGTVLGISYGILRIFYGDKDVTINVVCADYVINGILAVIWATHEDVLATRRKAKGFHPFKDIKYAPKVYAIVSTSKNFRFPYFVQSMVAIFDKYPSKMCSWVPCPNIIKSPILFKYLSIYYHFLATFFLDVLLKISGNKVRLLPIVRKVQSFLYAISYFVMHSIKFENSNMSALCDNMHAVDKELFLCDTRLFQFEKWSYTYMVGLKRYGMNDDTTDFTTVRKRYNRLRMAHYFVRTVFYLSQFFLIYLLSKLLGFSFV